MPTIAMPKPHSTSTTASISTVMLRGRLPMPTAERAWRPASPNTSTNRSEQPLMTSGCCAEAGHGVDHAQHLDDPHHPVEVAELRLHGGDQLQAGEPRVLVGLLDRDVLADDAGVHAAVGPIGALGRTGTAGCR